MKIAVNRYKVNPISNLVVVHDCLETKQGVAKILASGVSFRGHNGLKSISAELGGTKQFTRIAIGIGRPVEREPEVVANYVLSNISESEL